MSGDLRRIEIDLAVHRAIERRRRSFDETENDILRRLLLSPPRARPRAAGAPQIRRVAGAPRSRGSWTVEIGGERRAAANMKEAYRLLLRALAAAHPHFLEAFATETARGRRYVATTAMALYENSPHLARHAERLADGWYFDANLSETQVAKRARIAARLCGLFYGQDVRILDNLREV
jgi:negative regulator of replication initiation